jgi:hypothetical protein
MPTFKSKEIKEKINQIELEHQENRLNWEQKTDD